MAALLPPPAGSGGAFGGGGGLAAEFDDDARRSPAICWAEDDRVFAMTSMPGGRIMTGGAANGDISFYDSRTGERETVLSGHSEAVLALGFLAELNLLFSASADSTVRMWALDTLQNTMVFEGHRGFVVGLSVKMSEAATGLFSGSDDRTVKQWNINSGACVHTYKGHKGPVNCIALGDTHMFSGSSDGLLKVWELATRRCARTVEAHAENIWCIVVLTDGGVITGSSDTTIKVWGDLAAGGGLVHTLNGHKGKVRQLLVHEPMLFSAGADSFIHVWNMNTANHVEKLQLHEKQVSGLALNNNQLCTCGFDRLVARWDVSDLLPIKQPIMPYQALSAVRNKELEMAKLKVQEINQTRNKARLRNKSTEEIVAMYKELPVNFVVNALETKVESSRLSCEILIYIPFLISFVLIFLVARPVEDNYYLVKGVSESLSDKQLPSFRSGRNFYDVYKAEYFARWLQNVAEEVWAEQDSTGRPIFRGQNLLVGGLRIRTQRVGNRSCGMTLKRLAPGVSPINLYDVTNVATGATSNLLDPNRTWTYGDTQTSTTTGNARYDSFACFATNVDASTIDQAPFFCADPAVACPPNAADLLKLLGLSPKGFPYGADKGIQFQGQLHAYDAGGHYIDLLFNETRDVIYAKMAAISALGFVDNRATRLIDLNFHLYSPPLDLFVGVQHIIEVAAGGSYVAVLDRDIGYSIFTFQDAGALAFEIIFLIFVFVFLGLLINEGYSAVRKGNTLGFIFSWWNLLELTNNVTFIVLYSYRWSWMSESSKFNLALMLSTYAYPDGLQRALVLYQYQIWAGAITTILTFLKLLKYVRLNDRLNVLTRTLDVAQTHLVGVVAIFVYVLFGFALAGYILLGGQLLAFRSLSAAYVSLLRALLGDLDYGSLSDEQRSATLVYFWFFNALCVWTLLNFFVAVISDGFSEVAKGKSVIPLDDAIVKVYKDARFECLPHSLKLKWLLIKHRRTQTSLVSGTLENIMKERDTKVDKDAAARRDYDELDSVFMHKDEFMKNVPPEYVDLHTEEFMDEVWRDCAWEYHFAMQAEKGQEEADRERIAQEEVLQALRELINAFQVMDAIRTRLEAQHAKIAPFCSAIESDRVNQKLHRRQSTLKNSMRSGSVDFAS